MNTLSHMDDIFLFLNITPFLNDEALYARAHAAVTNIGRRERLSKIQAKRERCQSLGGVLLLQKALRQRGEEKPVFACGEHGKPYLPNRPDLHFNVSHSGDYVICALSAAPVGCDIEMLKPVRSHVAARCFSPEENAALAAQPDEAARETLFTRIWTLKESFLKAVGCGISVPLASVSFDFSGDAPVLRQTIVPGGSFFFREYGDLPGYRAALCKTTDTPFARPVGFSLMDIL